MQIIEKDSFSKEVTHGLKGILAIVIVGSHLSYATSIQLFTIFNKLGTTAVSLFLFISGYGITLSFLKNEHSYLNAFFRKRFWKVIYPMLIATIIYIAFNLLDKGFLPNKIFSNLIFKGITPLPNSWFIFALLYGYISFYIAFKLNTRKEYALIVIFLLSLLFITYTIYFNFTRAWWVTTLSFVTGVFYAIYRDKLFPIIKKANTIVIFTFIILGIIASKIEFLLLIPYTFIPLIVVALLSYVQLPLNNVFFNTLGSISYEIYLLHGIFIDLLRGKSIFIYSDYLYASLVFILSILSAFLFNYILKLTTISKKESKK